MENSNDDEKYEIDDGDLSEEEIQKIKDAVTQNHKSVKTELFKLSLMDQKKVAEMIIDPKEPSENLKKAFRSHKRLIASSEK